MKTLIVYATKHGCTARAANLLKNHLGEDTQVRNIRNFQTDDLNDAELVVLGASIHMGGIQRKMKTLLHNNHELLLLKRLGLYLCCMYKGDVAQKQFEQAFPESLRKHAVANGLFGGAFDFDQLNFFEKSIVKNVEGVTESVDTLNLKTIELFSQLLLESDQHQLSHAAQ